MWACECEQWAHEHEQVSQNEPFQEYLVKIDKILFDTKDEIFCDVEEYSSMCHGWMIFLDDKWMINKMDELSNECW